MATYLDGIVAHHRARVAADTRSNVELEALLVDAPSSRPFGAALRAGAEVAGVAVIAEVKRCSPSAGELAADLDPASLGTAYAAGGASCLSVLTEATHFGGSPEDLRRAREASGLPVLRKDFTLSLLDCYEARAMGADALLLIVAALDDAELGSLHAAAIRLGLDVLVEVHDEDELARARAVGARLVGVNQRDLRSFAVDTERALRLAEKIPDDVVRVAESGLRRPEDVRRLAAAGFDAVLVGEAFVTASDPRAAVASFALAAKPARQEA